MTIIIYGVLIILLTIISVQDVREKEISIGLIVIIGIVAFFSTVIKVITIEWNICDIVLGIAPGVAMILFSIITEKAIAIADGVIVLLIGLILNVRELLLALSIMFLLMTCVALLLLVFKKVNRKSQIAMVPFVTTGTALAIMWAQFA